MVIGCLLCIAGIKIDVRDDILPLAILVHGYRVMGRVKKKRFWLKVRHEASKPEIVFTEPM